MNHLKAIKISYKEADIKIRGAYTLNSEERSALYLLLRDYFNIQEALILSTCNRTEIYYVHKKDLCQKITGLLTTFKGCSSFQHLFSFITNGNEALQHLFRVGIGLDSQVLGDIQILGQVKQSYNEAINIGMAQTLLHRALHALFYTHKQVCQETSFKSGAASVSYNAVKLLKETELAGMDAKILVVGAGKMGSDVCRHLVHQGFKDVTVTNRSREKASALKNELKIPAIDYADMFSQLSYYDVLISTISADRPVFDPINVANKKIKKTFSCIDLSSPASFSADFVHNFSIRYLNIDQIGSFADATLSQREKEIPKVDAIIRQALIDFNNWLEEYSYTRQIKNVKDVLDQLRKESITQYLKKVDETQLELIEEVSKSVIERIIKHSAVQLKQTCARDHADQFNQTFNQLFNLEYNHISNLNERPL